jgi:hypothetical protein
VQCVKPGVESWPGERRVEVRWNEDALSQRNQGRQNQALEQTRDNVLRYGEVVGCELLNFFVRAYQAIHTDG